MSETLLIGIRSRYQIDTMPVTIMLLQLLTLPIIESMITMIRLKTKRLTPKIL